jgi:hypothetical protein
MFKWIAKKALDGSEKEIINFIEQIEQITPDEFIIIMSRAAFIHAGLLKNDFEFGMSLNSGLGDRQEKITLQIIELNSLMNQLHKSNLADMVIGAKVWNITFRCMSSNSFNHYGLRIWNFLSPTEFEDEIIEQIDEIDSSDDVITEAAKGLAGYIPPQFKQ